jgi:hypothetical protein
MMKNLFLKTSLIISFLTVSIGNAQSCPIPEPIDNAAIIGDWKGNFTQNGELKSFALNFCEDNDKLKAELTIPSISNKEIETEVRICESEELHIKFKVNNVEFELRGIPKNNVMSGRLVSSNSLNTNGNEIFSLKKSDGLIVKL